MNHAQWGHRTAVHGTGFINDLWIVPADGRRGWKVVALPSNGSKHAAALLHPHFSPDGRRLIWSERISGHAGPCRWLKPKRRTFFHDPIFMTRQAPMPGSPTL
jgi:hypothetical protein